MEITIDDVWHFVRSFALDRFVLPYVLLIYLGRPREAIVAVLIVFISFTVQFIGGGPSLFARLGLAPHIGLRQAFACCDWSLAWPDQVVLVTGSRGALGSELCAELLQRGATIVGVDVVGGDEPSKGERRQYFFQTDISSLSAVRALPAAIEAAVGQPVTVLINNAGVVHGRPILDLTDAEIDRSVGVNYLAHLHLIRAFLPDMIARKKGTIVTVSSALGLIGASGLTDYCSTKAALVGLHDSLTRELLHHYKTPFVRTHLVLPAFIGPSPLFARASLPTSFLFRFGAPQLEPAALAKAVVQHVGLGIGGVLSLPLFVNFVPLVRLLPPFLRELAQALAGADRAMDGFAPPRSEAMPPSVAVADGQCRRD